MAPEELDNSTINDKYNDGDMDLYGEEDPAVAAVGGLFSTSPYKRGAKDEMRDEMKEVEGQSERQAEREYGRDSGTSDIVDLREASAGSSSERPPQTPFINTSSIRRPTVREYKVREYFSDADDVSAEDSVGGFAASDTGRHPSATPSESPLPPLKRDSSNGDDVDYGDYIKMTSRQIAEEKARKGRNGLNSGAPRDTGMIRDASRSPAIRKEREGAVSAADMSKPQGGEDVRKENQRTDTARMRAIRTAAMPDGTRGPLDTGRTSGVRSGTGAVRTASSPGVSPHTGKLPVKGNVKRSEFFEPENGGDTDGGTISWTDPRVIMAGIMLLLVAVLTFLIIQNVRLNADLAKVDDNAEKLALVQAEYSRLQIASSGYEDEIKVLTQQLEDAKAGMSGQQGGAPTDGNGGGDADAQPPPGNGSTGLNDPSRPTPTPIPAASTREYEVKSGDSLQKIAREQLGDAKRFTEIQSLNNMTDDKIKVGQIIWIPTR